MIATSRVLLGAAVVVAGVACNSPTSVVCPNVPRALQFALTVYVKDSVTTLPGARGATLIARDGAFQDSVTIPLASFDELPVELAGSRAGTYSVTVRKNGYLDWTKNGVVVSNAGCGIDPVTLTAKLQPRTT